MREAAVLSAQVYVAVERAAAVAELLAAQEPVRRVARLGQTFDTRHELISVEMRAHGADGVIRSLEQAGVAGADIAIQVVNPMGSPDGERGRSWFGSDPEDFVWSKLVVQARRTARLFARYMVLMAVAGVLAAFGVIGRNAILIVGAMAVSPDLLPVCGACVGLIGRKLQLFWRALATLGVGMLVAALAAASLVLLLRATGNFAPHDIGDGGLGALTTVNYATVGIALAAGVAAILSFETNAGAAVGVAISVTTIPAAAFMGVATAAGDNVARAIGAFDVLLVNVALLLLAGSSTLLIQRRLRRRLPQSNVRQPL
jgi:uncharacterized hydrophobic protein (TIGR00271 family)